MRYTVTVEIMGSNPIQTTVGAVEHWLLAPLSTENVWVRFPSAPRCLEKHGDFSWLWTRPERVRLPLGTQCELCGMSCARRCCSQHHASCRTIRSWTGAWYTAASWMIRVRSIATASINRCCSTACAFIGRERRTVRRSFAQRSRPAKFIWHARQVHVVERSVCTRDVRVRFPSLALLTIE